ncbi:GAF domain-containing protein [Leuconostoc palmae]|uniref:GAF domain-containing protein n=1 Tax=Leuconostoc palmae TaxID=501487 RepID=UPI001C7D876F|nr:GAF domain-containing protein [Leuconostoc palmae]
MSGTKHTPLLSQLLSTWIEGEKSEEYPLANLSNAIGIIYQNISDINWVGFYLFNQKNNELVLGPFIGKPAVAIIAPGSGVVGKSFVASKTIVVDDVHKFSGHITCDVDSNSEIVVPIIDKNGNKIGVLDIDSPLLARFKNEEQSELEHFVQTLLEYI